jgi:hypothetical protein
MNQFEAVFNRANIYNMVFTSIDSVLQYQTLDSLMRENVGLYLNWQSIAENNNYYRDNSDSKSVYLKQALKYPEYNKIVSIACGTISIDPKNGDMKRSFKPFISDIESFVIENFFDYLEGFDIKQNAFCGFNLIKSRIPLLIKRFLINKDEFTQKNTVEKAQIPLVFKKILMSKPWDNDLVIDIDDVWKFNGMYTDSITSISNFLNLKTNVNILKDFDLSEFYWENINSKPVETLQGISKQSVNKVNILMQLANELRSI